MEEADMNVTQRKVIGVGCFAAEPTLARVLRKMVAAYSLGEWRTILSGEGSSEKCPIVRRLISGKQDLQNGSDSETIAGFFLGYENQHLKLSVFTRRKGQKSLKYTATLDALTCLRQKRLH
jgi:hypothetical protein